MLADNKINCKNTKTYPKP